LYIQPSVFEPFISFFHAERFQPAQEAAGYAFPGKRMNLKAPHFKRFLIHLSLPSPSLSLASWRGLSGGQGGDPSHHRPKQPLGQMALSPYQPVVLREFDKPAPVLTNCCCKLVSDL
jgi:hypothetical protein